VLGSFEVFNTRARKWTLFGGSSGDKSQRLITPRMNASACKCGPKHIYIFGGLTQDPATGSSIFLDSIERYNTVLNIWTQLQIRLPQKISNNFAFSFSADYIVLLGGMLKKDEAYIPRESTKIFELND
jgi:N-acetylneuraminic acid mutarotase